MTSDTDASHGARDYWCFISYSHADNREEGRLWATWLHQALENYEIPADLVGTFNERGEPIPESIFPVFRDEEELATGELGRRIDDALAGSKVLVVLCSPRAVASRHVANEILRFKSLRGNAACVTAIHGVIIDGDPGTSGGVQRDCFPEPLRFDVINGAVDRMRKVEPLAADFRLADGSLGWTSPEAYRLALCAAGRGAPAPADLDRLVGAHRERLADALLRLVAGVLGVSYGKLKERDKAYQLQRARVAAAHQNTHLARALLDTDPVRALHLAVESVAVLRDADPQALAAAHERISAVLRSGRWARIGESVRDLFVTANGRAALVHHADGHAEVVGLPSLRARFICSGVSEVSAPWGPDGAWRTVFTGRRQVIIDMRDGRRGLRPFAAVGTIVPPQDERQWQPFARFNHPSAFWSAVFGVCYVRSVEDDAEWAAVDTYSDVVDLVAGQAEPVDEVDEFTSNERPDTPCAFGRDRGGWFLWTSAGRQTLAKTCDVGAHRFSPTGAYLVVTESERIRVRTCSTGQVCFEVEYTSARCRLALSADDRLLLVLWPTRWEVRSTPGFELVATAGGDFSVVDAVAEVAGTPGAWTLSSQTGVETVALCAQRELLRSIERIDSGGRLALTKVNPATFVCLATGRRVAIEHRGLAFHPDPRARVFLTLHVDLGHDRSREGDSPDCVVLRELDDPARELVRYKREVPSYGSSWLTYRLWPRHLTVSSTLREDPYDPPFDTRHDETTFVVDALSGDRVGSVRFTVEALHELPAPDGGQPRLLLLSGSSQGERSPNWAIVDTALQRRVWSSSGALDPRVDAVLIEGAATHGVFVVAFALDKGAIHALADGRSLATLTGVVTRVVFGFAGLPSLAAWYRDGRCELWRACASGAERLVELGLVVTHVHFVAGTSWLIVVHADGRAYLLNVPWLARIACNALPVDRLVHAIGVRRQGPASARWWDLGTPPHHPWARPGRGQRPPNSPASSA